MITAALAGQPAISALRVTFMRRPRILTQFFFFRSILRVSVLSFEVRPCHLQRTDAVRSKQIHCRELKGPSKHQGTL